MKKQNQTKNGKDHRSGRVNKKWREVKEDYRWREGRSEGSGKKKQRGDRGEEIGKGRQVFLARGL